MPAEDDLFSEGNLLFESGQYEKAIDKYSQILSLVKDTNNHTTVFNAHTQLGECYHRLENFQEAMYHFHKARSLAEVQNDLSLLAWSQVNLVKMLVKDSSSYIEACYYLEETIRIFDQLNDKFGLKIANELHIELEILQKNFELKDIFSSAVSDVRQKNDELMAHRHQALTEIFLKKEITHIQTSLLELLDELGVNPDTPIMEGGIYMRPDIKNEDYLKILPIISRYEKILTGLDSFIEVKETISEIVDRSILVRLGNLFYWKALISQQNVDYEKAIDFYIRANQLKDDSILYLTIGSIFRKMGRENEGRRWIEGGFSRMRRRFDDDSRMPYPYIYYFPYPKGPPVASAEAIPKRKICPMCQKLLDYETKICPHCEYQFGH